MRGVIQATLEFSGRIGGAAGAHPSDQWSFWQFGYPAFMVTDTALFRNPNYHTPSDTPETLDYVRMARVTEGLVSVTLDLAAD
jgi:hypothetical protein